MRRVTVRARRGRGQSRGGEAAGRRSSLGGPSAGWRRAGGTAVVGRRRVAGRGPGRQLVALLLGALLLPTCERTVEVPADLPPGAVALQPGDSLLDHAGRIEVTAWPRTCLPPAVAQRVSQLWAEPIVQLLPEQWLGGQPTPLPDVADLGLDPSLPTRRFRLSPPVRCDLAAGRPWMTHEGRPLRRIALEPLGLQMQWVDPEGGALFWWDETRGDLVALATERPGVVGLGYAAESDFGLSAFEVELAAGEPPSRGDEVSGAMDVLRVQRRVLAAPAGASFELEVDLLAARELVLACALPDTGLRWEPSVAEPAPGVVRDERIDRRRLERAPRRSDGMVFRVLAAGTDGVWQRVWARRVQTTDGWVEARVDLSPWYGGPLRLALESDPGGDGDSAFDHGLWADLRLEDRRAPAPERPHLVLVVLSHWRPDRSSPWGAARDTTPHLALWAEGARRFDDVLAPAPRRLPALASLLTGQPPAVHGLADLSGRLDAEVTTLASRLAAAGYATRAVVEGGELVPDAGLAAGFETWRRSLPGRCREDWLAAVGKLAAGGTRPGFLLLQADGPQPPWRAAGEDDPAPPGFPARRTVGPAEVAAAAGPDGLLDPAQVGWLRRRYDAALGEADALLGDLFEELDHALDGAPCLVAVVGDTGQALAERGRVFGDRALAPEDLAVPLLLRRPDGRRGADERPRTTLDLAPTLLAAAGLPPAPDLPGLALETEVPAERPRRAGDPAGRTSVIAGPWQLVREADGSLSLLDWPGAPGRRADRAPDHPQVLSALGPLLPESP